MISYLVIFIQLINKTIKKNVFDCYLFIYKKRIFEYNPDDGHGK